MRRLLLASCLAVATLSGCAGVSINESAGIERVLAAPSRSAADRERDARDKPAEVLALAKFKRGDTVADILAGGGYYSEILSGIVGPNGKVLLVNNPGYDGFGKKGYTERLAGNRLPNVQHIVGPSDALGMGENVLDGAVIVMSYHDLYWVDDKQGWPKVDAGQFLDQVTRALKPGGVLGRPQREAGHRQCRCADPAPHRRAIHDRRLPQARAGMGGGDPGAAQCRRRPQQERVRPGDPRQDRSFRAPVPQAGVSADTRFNHGARAGSGRSAACPLRSGRRSGR